MKKYETRPTVVFRRLSTELRRSYQDEVVFGTEWYQGEFVFGTYPVAEIADNELQRTGRLC